MSRRRRPKAPDRVGRVIAPLPRFTAGILAMVPFLMQDRVLFRAILVGLFALTAVLAGKRIRWSYFLILAASVTFFHLLAPIGRVILELGPFTITAGALVNGIGRALTLIGMVFLSLAAVRPELELPGRFGGLLARTFYYFEAILDGKARLSRKDFFTSLDALLMERFDPNEEDFGHGRKAASDADPVAASSFRTGRWQGSAAGLLFVLVPWFLWLLTLPGFPWI